MTCGEAQRVLAERRGAAPAAVRAARAHLTMCAACQARLDQFGAAILSSAADEIPCAECRGRLDAYAALELTGERAGRRFPLVRDHLETCPECAEDYRFLLAGLIGLREEALPEPPAYPRFSTSFAGVTPATASHRPPTLRPGLLARWRAGLASMPWQWLSRGSLAGMAAAVLVLFAGLVAFWPELRNHVETLAPFGPLSRTLTPAEVAATQTMEAAIGRDWLENAGGPTRTGEGGAGGGRHSGTGTATTDPTSDARHATSTALAAARDAREGARRATARGPRLTATVTPTLAITLTRTAPPPRETEVPAQPPEPTSPPAAEPEKPRKDPYPPPEEPDPAYP